MISVRERYGRMKLVTKIIVAVISGAIAIIALALFNHFSYSFFTQRLIITDTIDDLKVADRDLNIVALQSNRLSHINQDELHQHIRHIDLLINQLNSNEHLQKMHPKTIASLENYTQAFDQKTQDSYDFQTISSTIKNSSTSLLVLQNKAHISLHHTNPKEHLLLDTLTHINIIILKSKTTLDPQLLGLLYKDMEILKNISFAQKPQQQLLEAVIRHTDVFINIFESYINTFERIQTSKTTEIAHNLSTSFKLESDAEMKEMVIFALLLVILYILSLGIIVYFIVQAERDMLTDKLTNLQNRKAFGIYVNSPRTVILVLININKFKNFNDFYGVAFGDQILIQTAKRLANMVASEKKAKLFRIGGDEFGITCIAHTLSEVEEMAKNMADTFQDTTISIEEIEISVSISVAISNQKPLLETADMTLKELKKFNSKNTLLYSDDFRLFEHIQANIVKTHIFENAIKNDRVFPYFQPIVSLQTGQIDKYESLARLQLDSGEVQSIVGYLDILKESKYASALTHIMIQKSCEIMQDKECQFSINLAIDDISNPLTIEVILNIFTLYPNISNQIIFEILESEAVDDYQQLSRFIKEMKNHGCKIAIDDFGSGYSNFAHILNLDIDILKLDGSLIRNLNTNDNTAMIVETIVNFAKRAGIETVAEFVCDEEICFAVKMLGIDYAQGYYTGKPEALG